MATKKPKKPTKSELALKEFNDFLTLNKIVKKDEDTFVMANTGILVNYNLPIGTLASIKRVTQVLSDIDEYMKMNMSLNFMKNKPEINIGTYKSIGINNNALYIPKTRLDDKVKEINIATMFNAMGKFTSGVPGELESSKIGVIDESNYLKNLIPSESVDKRLSSISNQIKNYNITGYDPSNWTQNYQDDIWYKRWKGVIA